MRFLLLAHQRTGTTVFRSLINQHRQLFCYNEAFFPSYYEWGWYSYIAARIKENPDLVLPKPMGQQLRPYFETLFLKKEMAGRKIVGVDTKIPHVELIRGFHFHVRAAGYGILHMRRRNTLAAIVSRLTMEARQKKRGGRAHGTTPAINEPIHLDLERLAHSMELFELQDRNMNLQYRSGRYLQLYYEDFTSDRGWAATCEQLSGFFGMNFVVPFATHLVKQNSADLAELIENAAEVRRAYPHFFTT